MVLLRLLHLNEDMLKERPKENIYDPQCGRMGNAKSQLPLHLRVWPTNVHKGLRNSLPLPGTPSYSPLLVVNPKTAWLGYLHAILYVICLSFMPNYS